MFRELLDRDLILEQTRRLRDYVRDHLEERRGDLEVAGEGATTEELFELLPKLVEANEVAEAGEDLHGGQSPVAYLPRNATVSLIQARLEQCVRRRIAALPGDVLGVESLDEADGGISAELLEQPLPPVTDEAIPAELGGQGGIGTEISGPFEPCDPEWLSIGLAFGWREIRGKRKFNDEPARENMGANTRLVLLSDWATGIPRARRLSATVAKVLSESRNRQCHVVHLGDTYYAGWGREQQKHVLDCWPVPDRDAATSWALPGNHDYYSGGRGFFDTLLGDFRFRHQSSRRGPTSIFELANEHWRVIGLDTGWKDHDLNDDQVAWLGKALNEAIQAGQRPILLSHHQPWSAFTDDTNPNKLGLKVEPLLPESGVAAWFWGHEHRLALYRPRGKIERPRLIGNGGVPEYLMQRRPSDELVGFDYQDEITDVDPRQERWCRFAFAVLDLDGDELSEWYFDEYANPIVVSS